MSESAGDRVVYTIDQDNRICAIGEGWQAAAEQGRAARALDPERVLGMDLGDFVYSDVTLMYYATVFRLCRLRGEPISREYRCDSPTHRRYMRVTMIPRSDGRIILEHETLREEPFPHRVGVRDITGQETAPAPWLRCSMCNRLQRPGESTWEEPQAVASERAVELPVIHAVCPACQQTDWRAIWPVHPDAP
jgi:hypothetical protein